VSPGRHHRATLDIDDDPVAALRQALRSRAGRLVRRPLYAGYENKVKRTWRRITRSTWKISYQSRSRRGRGQVKNGKRQQVQNKVFPGYILGRMELTAESYSCVRNTPGVTGFVGATDRAARPAAAVARRGHQWLAPAATTDTKKAKAEIKVPRLRVGDS